MAIAQHISMPDRFRQQLVKMLSLAYFASPEPLNVEAYCPNSLSPAKFSKRV